MLLPSCQVRRQGNWSICVLVKIMGDWQRAASVLRRASFALLPFLQFQMLWPVCLFVCTVYLPFPKAATLWQPQKGRLPPKMLRCSSGQTGCTQAKLLLQLR